MVEHFAGPEWHVDPRAIPLLERYSWPGNVRQLQNAIDRAKILADDDVITVENLPPEITEAAHVQPTLVASGDVDLETLTQQHVLDTYRRHGGNKARTARPDAIVLDLMLPKMDGYKICSFLKFDERFKTIPIVLLTARAHPVDEVKAREVGADHFMTKPCDLSRLVGVVRQCLPAAGDSDPVRPS